jgi:hypothetical protein
MDAMANLKNEMALRFVLCCEAGAYEAPVLHQPAPWYGRRKGYDQRAIGTDS